MIPLLLFQLFSPVDPAPLAKFHEERIARLTPGTPEARAAHKDLGLFWLRVGKTFDAETHLRLAIPDPEVIPYLAEAVAAQGRDADAETLFESCRAKARCLSRLADFAERRNDAAAAGKLLREALDAEPNGVRRNAFAQHLHAAGQRKQAEALYRTAIAELTQSHGPAHPETAITQNNLATLLSATSRNAEAEPLQRKALATMQKTLGPRHARTGLAASNLADILRARGAETEARKYYSLALKIFEDVLPPGHPWTAEARDALRAKSR